MEEEEMYPALSGTYEIIFEDVDAKEIYRHLRKIATDLPKDHLDDPFGPLAAVMGDACDTEELYYNLIESVVIRQHPDEPITTVSLHWTNGIDTDEMLTQYYAYKLLEALNPLGNVSCRTYTERPDGSTYYEHRLLMSEDFVFSPVIL